MQTSKVLETQTDFNRREILQNLSKGRARHYDSSINRFTTLDPIGLAGGLNSYVYVSGNPLSLIDPNGLFPKSIEEAGECLHGNIDVIIKMYSEVIANNLKEIESLRQKSEKKANCSNENKDMQKRINHLTRVTSKLQQMIESKKEMCSFFPTLD